MATTRVSTRFGLMRYLFEYVGSRAITLPLLMQSVAGREGPVLGEFCPTP
jgi:hypothetical protein